MLCVFCNKDITNSETHTCEIVCPVTDKKCEHYLYQRDTNHWIVLDYCTHVRNKDNYEGNCTKNSCPLMTKGD